MYLRKNLIYLRKKRNFTIRKLEQLTGINHGTICLIETGKTNEMKISIGTVVALLKVFEVPFDDFMNKDLAKDNI